LSNNSFNSFHFGIQRSAGAPTNPRKPRRGNHILTVLCGFRDAAMSRANLRSMLSGERTDPNTTPQLTIPIANHSFAKRFNFFDRKSPRLSIGQNLFDVFL